MYNRINDKLVGLLIRARKRGLLHFEGEMLYQSRDDEEWVVLSKSINTVRAYFGRPADLPGGGTVDPEVRGGSMFRCNSRWYGIVWYGMVWYGMVQYGMVWYSMVWYGTVWYVVNVLVRQ